MSGILQLCFFYMLTPVWTHAKWILFSIFKMSHSFLSTIERAHPTQMNYCVSVESALKSMLCAKILCIEKQQKTKKTKKKTNNRVLLDVSIVIYYQCWSTAHVYIERHLELSPWTFPFRSSCWHCINACVGCGTAFAQSWTHLISRDWILYGLYAFLIKIKDSKKKYENTWNSYVNATIHLNASFLLDISIYFSAVHL